MSLQDTVSGFFPNHRVPLRSYVIGRGAHAFGSRNCTLYYANTAQFSPNNYQANYAD